MRFAVGDVHGHRHELRQALQQRELVDAAGDWSGGPAEVWFLGDLMDRGPDGVGVVADVMRWQQEARAAGGVVGSVLGNHEVLALGFRRFRDAVLRGGSSWERSRSFMSSWIMNGGQTRDQNLLTDDMADWMSRLPAMKLLGDDLLVHADTNEYLRWGRDVESINDGVTAVLQGDRLELTWALWAAMTDRHAFVGAEGADRVRRLLATTGASRVVHGHSIIGDLTNVASSSVTEAWSYADGLALAVDGGIYDGGPSLVVPLD